MSTDTRQNDPASKIKPERVQDKQTPADAGPGSSDPRATLSTLAGWGAVVDDDPTQGFERRWTWPNQASVLAFVSLVSALAEAHGSRPRLTLDPAGTVHVRLRGDDELNDGDLDLAHSLATLD